jgi:hypothetical protein
MQTSSICASSLVLREMKEVFFTVANLADVELATVYFIGKYGGRGTKNDGERRGDWRL